MYFSWLSPHFGSARPGNAETTTYEPNPHADNDVEKAIPHKGQEHEDFVLFARKVTTTRKVMVCSVALVIMLALLLLPVFFCGVFQEAKDTAEDHATGIVLQNSTVIPSSTSWSSKLA